MYADPVLYFRRQLAKNLLATISRSKGRYGYNYEFLHVYLWKPRHRRIYIEPTGVLYFDGCSIWFRTERGIEIFF